MARPLLPNSYVNFQDGQLPRGPLSSGIPIFVGPGVGSAVLGALTPITSPNDIQTLFGVGPLARDLTTYFLEGAGFAYGIRLAEDTAGSIGTVAVGQFTGLTAGGTSHGAFDVRGRVVVAGTLGIAQVAFSVDGGNTWGSPQVLVAGANPVKGPGNFQPGLTVTPTAMSYAVDAAGLTGTSTQEFSFQTVAPQSNSTDILAALDSIIQNPSLFFNLVHISHAEADEAATKTFAQSVAAKMLDAQNNWDKYIYAVLQAPVLSTPSAALAFAQAIRADAADKRIQYAIQPVLSKSMGGQFIMVPSAAAVARRMSLAPQSDLGQVAAGSLNSVVGFAPGWGQSNVIAMDQVQNNVTVRKITGAAGFYFTNGWMSDPTSDYSMDKFRLIADLCAADVRSAGVPFIKMDVDPADPVKSAEGLLMVCRAPLAQRATSRPAQLSGFSVTIPPGQDILTSKVLVVEVSLKPIASADWIQFNIGFKSPFTGG